MKITQLVIYPVKSLGGIALDDACLTAEGLARDRRWMVVDDVGRFVTQRQLPAMATIRVSVESEALVLSHPGVEPLCVPLAARGLTRRSVTVWEDRCDALDEGPEARAWLRAVLGDLRGSGLSLVRFATDHRRRVEPHSLAPGEEAHTGFADGFPFLVSSTATLAELNRRLLAKGLEPVPMSRFRPNIVVETAAPLAEDDWCELAAADGRWRLGLRKPCQRCKIITVDQRSGVIALAGEPLRTLVEMNARLAPGGYFGQNAILLAGDGARLSVGDTVTSSLA